MNYLYVTNEMQLSRDSYY